MVVGYPPHITEQIDHWEKHKYLFENIIGKAAQLFGVTKQDIKSKSRDRLIVDIRIAISRILNAHFSTNTIAFLLNKKQSNINHYLRSHNDLISSKNPNYKTLYNQLKQEI